MSYQNNTIEALKKLYVAMGGTAADVENLNITPEMISAIADIYEDKGDTLPAVTADDNGKLLTVVNGDWDKADKSPLIVTYTVTGEPHDNIYPLSSSHTLAQIGEALAVGRDVVAKVVVGDEGTAFAFAVVRDAPSVMMYTAVYTVETDPIYIQISHGVLEGEELPFCAMQMTPLATVQS